MVRIDVISRGKRTSVSLDEHLFGYLRTKLAAEKPSRSSKPAHHADDAVGRVLAADALKREEFRARKWVRDLVEAGEAADLVPASGISQWVQQRIIDAIAAPAFRAAADDKLLSTLTDVMDLLKQRRREMVRETEARAKRARERRAEALARLDLHDPVPRVARYRKGE